MRNGDADQHTIVLTTYETKFLMKELKHFYKGLLLIDS